MACRNLQLAKLRAHKRLELLAATERHLDKIKARVDAGKLSAREQIGLRVGKVINQYKFAKHFELSIGENALSCVRKHESIAAEAALDGPDQRHGDRGMCSMPIVSGNPNIRFIF